jgi:hypothetical protein
MARARVQGLDEERVASEIITQLRRVIEQESKNRKSNRDSRGSNSTAGKN